MKSQVLTLLFLTIGSLLFQSTHQYRLQKREITEYDLTNFIVNTCAADNNDMIIQNLCDQTLQSAIMGNFPVLIYYCKMIGRGNRYCDNLNQYHHPTEAKRFTARRIARNTQKINRLEQETDTNIDLKSQEIIRKCLNKSNRFCEKKLEEIRQGQYPDITKFCQKHSEMKFCQHLLLSSWSVANQSSSSPKHSSNIDTSNRR